MFNVVKTIVKHTMIYGVGDLLAKSIGFLLIPLYTHYLTTAQYGTMELLDLTSYVVGMFLAMGISQSVVRYYYEFQDEDRRNQVVSIALITVWAVSIAALIPLLVFSENISLLIFSTRDNYQFFDLVFMSLLINMTNEIPMTLLRIQQHSMLYVVLSISRLIINLSLNIILIVYFQLGISGVLFSSLISSVLLGGFLLVYTLRRTKLTYSLELAKSMIGYSFPLVGSWVGMYVLNFADRFFLQRLASLADVGVYSLAYKFGMIPNMLLGSFMQIWGPKRFELLKERDAKPIYGLVFTYFWFVQVFVGLGIAVLIHDLISLVAGPEYRDAHQFVPVLLLAYMCYGCYSYFQFGLLLEKRTKRLALITLSAAVVNTAANYLLIPHLHIWGAALATLLSFVYLALVVLYFSQRLYPIPYQTGRLAKMTIVAAILYFLALLINPSYIWLSIGMKLIIVLCLPVILYLLGFFSGEEMEKFGVLRDRVISSLRSASSKVARLGAANRRETP